MTAGELRHKFLGLASPVLGEGRARTLAEAVDRLDTLDDLDALSALLAAN
jgi:hypothetical protein